MAETIHYLVGDGVLVWFVYHLAYWLRRKKAPPLRHAPGRIMERLVGLNVPALRARWRKPIVAAGLDPLLARVVAAGYYLRALECRRAGRGAWLWTAYDIAGETLSVEEYHIQAAAAPAEGAAGRRWRRGQHLLLIAGGPLADAAGIAGDHRASRDASADEVNARRA